MRCEYLMYKTYKKVKKLINKPELFFRDYLNKKYPIFNGEQNIAEVDEAVVVRYEVQQSLLEAKLISCDMPIDVVFTWVDNTDKVWQTKYRSASQQTNQEVGLYAKDSARFENHNELYYSIRSVLKHLEWVNHIFIVTDNQKPNWLSSINCDKITVIDHTQIIDEKYLPTFNSHVIEANLHKIPNLRENFIYFNDDVFVARPLPKTHFFSPNGNASIFVSDKSLLAMKNKGVVTPTLFACLNCQALLNKTHHTIIDNTLVHTYMPLKKSNFEKAWQLYGDEIVNFLPNKFRRNNDLNLATFLVPYLMYLEGNSSFVQEICYYFNIRSNNADIQYNKLLQKKFFGEPPHSFCANDFNGEQSTPDFKENLEHFLKSYFNQ